MENKFENIKFKLYNGVDIPLPDSSVIVLIILLLDLHYIAFQKLTK